MAPSRKGKEKEASSSRSKPPLRGRNAYIKPPANPDERPMIRQAGWGSFVGDLLIATKNVNKIISQCARYHFPQETNSPDLAVCRKFDDYPDTTKKEVQEEFLTHFQFSQDENIDDCWKTFSAIANRKLQNLLNKCKDDACDKYGDNILEWKDRGVPRTYDWITANNWPKLCDYWCSDEFARQSHRNRVNRTASDDSSFATTGSVNMLFHKQKFENENQREPRWSDELFVPTHTKKKTGQFISAKAQKAQEDYDRDMIAKYGPDRNHWPSFDADIWYSNTNNNVHGDNYGLGALGKTRSMYRSGGSQTSSAPPPLRQEHITAISNQVLGVIQPQITQLMEEMRRSMGRSPSHQRGSGSHHASISDAQNDGDDIGDDWSGDDVSLIFFCFLLHLVCSLDIGCFI